MLTEKDWQHHGHLGWLIKEKRALFIDALNDKKEAQLKSYNLFTDLANKITYAKKYELLISYFMDFLSFPKNDTNADLINLVLDEIYSAVCRVGGRGKFLFGIKNGFPLWHDLPITLTGDSDEDGFRFTYIVYLFVILGQYLTGKAPQVFFDRLLLPRIERTCSTDYTHGDDGLILPVLLGETLGRKRSTLEKDGFRCQTTDVARSDIEHLLSEAALNKRFSLVPDRPVLIKFEDNKFLNRVILQLKDNTLFARVETSSGDLLQTLDLDTCDTAGTINFFLARAQANSKDTFPEFYEGGYLLALLYKDLVTAEEVTSTRKIKTTPGKTNPHSNAHSPSWKYIPRKVYTSEKTDVIVEREPLSEREVRRQQAIRRYHAVMGHVRHFHDRKNWVAKPERLALAEADGVILRENETYVRPHARGVSALNELGEIDINSLPHYLRRKVIG